MKLGIKKHKFNQFKFGKSVRFKFVYGIGGKRSKPQQRLRTALQKSSQPVNTEKVRIDQNLTETH